MIRVVFYLIAVGLAAFGVAKFADIPGSVVVTWQGAHLKTSLLVMGAALLVAFVALYVIVAIIRAILRSPLVLSRTRRHRRGLRAYEAISSGLIAIGAGDIAAAKKFAAQVNQLAPSEPLALLLSAQAAQLSGDRDAAERVFQAMANRPDTKALGLHGLFIEARRRNDLASAQAFAEEAARTAPSLGWAGRAVLEFRCATGDWAGALTLLERSRDMLDRATYRRQRAVLLTAQALAAEDSDRDAAKAHALEAQQLAPTLIPAAGMTGRLLAEGGYLRKASRIIEKAWRANPHPDLARAYAQLRYGDAARDRLKRIEALARQTPDNIEGALALARAALDAREFAQARAALKPYLDAPTKRVCLLMAALERAEHNDEGRAREWTARAVNAAPDPAWTADGFVSDHWLPASPVTGRIDAFEWRVPLTGTLSAPAVEPAIEPETPTVKSVEAPATPEPERVAPPTIAPTPVTPPIVPPAISEPPSVKTESKPEPGDGKPEPVIPLVHAPDDPGPEGDESEPAASQSDGGWRKILG
ncbi:MAG TPA: heme biosynthesis HemY N-terminal domain-containing protein [Xanthobacteraceae bacterium]|jgi:HemY protein|nr:heme biosynthesis HemY N-terminal domain-containing protein [Xanthobacteraceae bacterium]